MNSKIIGDELCLYLEGRIDSANAAETEKEITAIREKAGADHIVIDAENLSYISSAGLRVLLRLRKAVPNTEIINVRNDVYEIFEMTGFTEMMKIRKAYRRVSLEGCEVIGQGANGRVYRLDRETIVKEYFSEDALPEIQREREKARTAFVLGIPTAIPYDVVRLGDSYGAVYELLNAKSLAELMISGKKSLDEVVRLSIELLRQIHKTEVKPGTMDDMKQVAVKWALFLKDYLEPKYYEKLISLVEAVPEMHLLVHGDYHLKNVMYQNGETILIDMDTLSYGHPIFEFASMFNAYRAFGETDHENSRKFLGFDYETAGEIWDKSLRCYLDTENENRIREVSEKAAVIGYTRLMRRTIRRDGLNTEKGRLIIENCRMHLEDLLMRIDTLVF